MSRVLRAFWLAVAAAGLAFGAMAQPALRDPAVPEALRHARPAAETWGEALRAQVQAKLRARFDAADTTRARHHPAGREVAISAAAPSCGAASSPGGRSARFSFP